MNVMKGPVTSMVRVTDSNLAKSELAAAGVSISEVTLSGVGADCDNDGIIEPLAFRTDPRAPIGGGLLPENLGVATHDPWHRPYGYCAWDHGTVTRTHDVAGCGGSSAGRLIGASQPSQVVIAVISSGRNGIFETSCHDWVDENEDNEPDHSLVNKPSGSDDMVRIMPYGQFLLPSAAQAKLDELPDATCTQGTVGIMRITLGVVQVCGELGWVEISPASGGDINFIPLTNVMLGTTHQSNEVVFGSLAEYVTVSIDGGAQLSINDGPWVTSGTVGSGDKMVLRGQASTLPEVTNNYAVKIGAVTKPWAITTRDAYIGKLSIQPGQSPVMSVQGPGSPAHGNTVTFLVSNVGERPVGPMLPAVLSNTVNFSFHNGGAYVGDDCAGKTLAGTTSGAAGSCVIDVRPKATADVSLFQGGLSVGDGQVIVEATLTGNAQGWDCDLPWGGKLANGATATAFLQSCSLLICKSESRKCTNGHLSGSYQFPLCNALLC